MSWISGFISNYAHGNSIPWKRYPDRLFDYQSHKFTISAGGYSENVYFNTSNNDEGWIICGTGVLTYNSHSEILNKEGWFELLNSSDFPQKLSQLGGHFVIVKWERDNIRFYSDTLGLRDIYLAKTENHIFFTTRIDWLKNYIDPELDIEIFGCRWQLFNQLNSKSIFKNVERVVAGRYVRIDLNNDLETIFNTIRKPHIACDKPYDVTKFNDDLHSLVNVKLPNEKKLSLSLSGGMDSRVILAYLLKNKELEFETHTFGHPDHPDSKIALKIVKDFNLFHEQIDLTEQSPDLLIKQMKEYISQTLINNTASSIFQLNNYSQLANRNLLIIDGGFGEIWRREFFYKLYLQGKNHLLNKNSEGIIPYLQYNRADIFSEEINNKMNKGVKKQVSEIFDLLPSVNKNNIENWLDELAIKTRLTNFFSHEQSRLDHYVSSYMPFIQPKIMHNVFNMSTELRTNGRLFREIIKINSPSLRKYQLAKGVSNHPFFFNSLQSRIWNVLQHRLNIGFYRNNRIHDQFGRLKEYINDTAGSRSVKEFGLYDYTKIENIVAGYYDGNKSLVTQLDWWLSFELFRQHYFDKS